MPKYLKILFISLSILIIVGLLAFVINGQIVPKTRSIIKVSGFKDNQELGKFVYRQLYGRLVYVDNIIISSNAEQIPALEKILTGFQAEAKRLKHEPWVDKAINEFADKASPEKSIYVSLAESYFRASVEKEALKSKTIFIHLDYLFLPKENSQIPAHCDQKENFFTLECIKSRVAMVAAGKWKKVRSCRKATLDQVAGKDYLILLNERECM